jgi:hypothetical protein
MAQLGWKSIVALVTPALRNRLLPAPDQVNLAVGRFLQPTVTGQFDGPRKHLLGPRKFGDSAVHAFLILDYHLHASLQSLQCTRQSDRAHPDHKQIRILRFPGG